MQIALLTLAAVLFAFGGLGMNYSNGMTKLLPSAAFLLLFCAGAACQALAMRPADMSVVYIFVLGLESVVALVLSVIMLGERLSVSRIVAVVLIVGGMMLLRR